MNPSGLFDADAADRAVRGIGDGGNDVIDFADVTGISFAALRRLLDARQSGKGFTIVNVCDKVAEKFDDTGVSAFVRTSRRPKPLDLSSYVEFGKSHMSHAYRSADGDSILKVYGKNVPMSVVSREKAVARAVMVFGIPTPLVGTIYEDGDSKGIDFERIEGKKSFSKIIADEPDRLEEVASRFAAMCRKLHTTPCDTAIFSNKAELYRNAVTVTDGFSEDEKNRILQFLDGVPECTTCLHGDMQPSNVISTPSGDMWIDLSDFGYGYPMFDMGMLYFLTHFSRESETVELFHFGNETALEFWNIFLREYFGAGPAEQEKIEKEIMKYAALHMIYLGATYGYYDYMYPVIRKLFFEN